MSTKYKAITTDECYFITITTVGWVDVFTRLNQKQNIINALKERFGDLCLLYNE
jgi:hypothetical protein